MLWNAQLNAPKVHAIHTIGFHKLTPMANHVDLRDEGRIHYWAKVEKELKATLVMCRLADCGSILRIEYQHCGGIWVTTDTSSIMQLTSETDDEMFLYCLAGFANEFMKSHYDFVNS